MKKVWQYKIDSEHSTKSLTTSKYNKFEDFYSFSGDSWIAIVLIVHV